MIESEFRKIVTSEIKDRLPGSILIKGNSATRQGIPDWLVLYKDKWAALELKKSSNEPVQPNQPYYVERMNDMSFSAFVNPENYVEVLDRMESKLRQ